MSEDRDHLLRPATARWLAGVLVFASLYAFVRYNVFKGIELRHWPLFINNKALSFGGMIMLALSYVTGKVRWLRYEDAEMQSTAVKFFGLLGFSLIAMHTFASLLLYAPAYYPSLFHDGHLSLDGELSMALGVLSLWCFTIPAMASIPHMYEELGAKRWRRAQRTGYLGLAAAAGHVAAIGARGWLSPREWPGYMPPITLLSALVALFPVALKLKKRMAAR